MWQELCIYLTKRTVLNRSMLSTFNVGVLRTNFAIIGMHNNFQVESCASNSSCHLTHIRQIQTKQEELPSVLDAKTRGSEVKKKINRAMKAYLERAVEYDNFMKEQITEFEIGKRHLANMMGMDPETITQEEIDRAIEYLFPSGLYEKKARPTMKHPHQVFAKKKAAEFDINGRPHHYLFYTTMPNFYECMHNIAEKMNELNKYEDQMIEKQILTPPGESRLNLSGSRWFNKEELEKFILEEIEDFCYNYFITTVDRLSEHPYSFHAKDFIMQFRKDMKAATKSLEVQPLQYIGDRSYATAEGVRKTAKAVVTVYGKGTGKVKINDSDLSYFSYIQEREQILFPLQFTDLLFKVDVEATVDGAGISCQAGAIRHGLSKALCSFITPDTMEKMRIAGLLTSDRRKRERKKPGQKGARAKYTWRKR